MEGMSDAPGSPREAAVIGRTWLTPATFSLDLERPHGFAFTPGQSITLHLGSIQREYSIVSGILEPRLSLLVRLIPTGSLSPALAAAPEGTKCSLSGPHGCFTYQESRRQKIFVASGTGIAPFVSMARSGVRGFTLLHGVRSGDELYFEPELRAAAARYVPCLSRDPRKDAFSGRVTEAAMRMLSPGVYDFYLCGGRSMIRDLTVLADDKFVGSRVFAEVFH
jgi:benzoate/toluate 1,2-dioxygenase reductase component